MSLCELNEHFGGQKALIVGRFGGPERRRSPRHGKRFRATLEFDGKVCEIRTIDISRHGVFIPRRLPPPVGTQVKVTIMLRDETCVFEGIVVRHAKCFAQGRKTSGAGIDFPSPEYEKFVRDKIILG